MTININRNAANQVIPVSGPISLKDCDDNPICTNYPLAVDGDSVYVKDLDLDLSSIGTFTGTIESLFSNYYSEITDETATAIKSYTLVFVRPVSCSSVGMASQTGDFSNVVLKFQTSSGQIEYLLDDSGNNTKYKAWRYPIEPQTFDTLVIEFHTSDFVKISGMAIQKDVTTVSRMQALKPNGTVTSIDATAGGNLKVAVEEFEEQLRSTQTDFTTNLDGRTVLNTAAVSYGRVNDTTVVPIKLDGSTQDIQVVEHEHAEIHGGDHYFACDYALNQANGATIEFVVATPNTLKWAHMDFEISTSDGAVIEIYEGTTDVVGGTALVPPNNNRNSTNTSALTITKDPTSLTAGVRIAGFLAGGGRTAGVVTRNREIILKQDETYLFRITSLAVSNDISWCGEWYEHTDKN